MRCVLNLLAALAVSRTGRNFGIITGMKLRRILLIVVLVGGFLYVTTHLPRGIFPSLGHFASAKRVELAAGTDRGAPRQLRLRGAEQHHGVPQGAARGGQHHLQGRGLRLLLWRGAGAGPGLGFRARPPGTHPHQLPRGAGATATGGHALEPASIRRAWWEWTARTIWPSSRLRRRT